MENEEKLSEEEYLRRHIENVERERKRQEPLPEFQPEPELESSGFNKGARIDELEYFNIDTKELPCGIFYPAGSYIQIRSASVLEIQYFSMVDDKNIYDILEKINYILSSCLKLKLPGGVTKTYIDLKDPDKFFCIFLIREITFQKGNYLVTTATCSDGTECKIELRRENFEFWQPSDKIKRFYNPELRCFSFETTNDFIFHIAPPTIGIQKNLLDYVQSQNNRGKKVNPSFLKIMPYLTNGQNNLSEEKIMELEKDFSDPEKMDDISFQFLNSTINIFKFGIKCAKSICCGEEVRSESLFPRGASSLFVIHDAFDRYLKK